MILGQIIQAWRKQERLSLQKASRLMGVEYTALWRFERGRPVNSRCWVALMLWLLSEDKTPRQKQKL
jgi:transcriptional regulator with XRE-family HTH domain